MNGRKYETKFIEYVDKTSREMKDGRKQLRICIQGKEK